MSVRIKEEASNTSLSLRVQGRVVVVTSVTIRDSGPVVVVQPPNLRLYAGLGGGLGAGLLLVVVVAVILGVVVYMYRRYV